VNAGNKRGNVFNLFSVVFCRHLLPPLAPVYQFEIGKWTYYSGTIQ